MSSRKLGDLVAKQRTYELDLREGADQGSTSREDWPSRF